MKRALVIVAALLAVQGALLVAWRSKRPPEPLPVESIAWPVPELEYVTRDGRRERLAHRDGAVVVHFWATWCPPCREELPALLEWAETAPVATLAVSLDPEWATVTSFLGRVPPPSVVRARSRAAADAFRVRQLPETFVVDERGIVVLRFTEAVDWSSGRVRRAVEEAVAR